MLFMPDISMHKRQATIGYLLHGNLAKAFTHLQENKTKKGVRHDFSPGAFSSFRLFDGFTPGKGGLLGNCTMRCPTSGIPAVVMRNRPTPSPC